MGGGRSTLLVHSSLLSIYLNTELVYVVVVVIQYPVAKYGRGCYLEVQARIKQEQEVKLMENIL